MPNEKPVQGRGPMHEEAFRALCEAVWGVIQEHKQLGMPLWILRDGKVVQISAEEAEAEHLTKKAEYEATHPPLPYGRRSDS